MSRAGSRSRSHQAAHALLGVAGRLANQESAGVERVEEHRGHSLDFAGGGQRRLLRRSRGLGVARQFVEAHGHGLPQIHGDVALAGGNVQQPVTVAEIGVREAALFGAEEKRHAIRTPSACESGARRARAGAADAAGCGDPRPSCRRRACNRPRLRPRWRTPPPRPAPWRRRRPSARRERPPGTD